MTDTKSTGKRYLVNPGSIANLRIEEFEPEQPTGNEVRIAVKALGLNFADIFAVQGLYRAAPKTDFTPGLEFAGEIDAIGPDVKKLKPGDRVMGVCRFGAYSSHVISGEEYMVSIPDNWDYETAAAYPVQTITAWYGLMNLGNLEEGQGVLIHSVAGGVGLQALKIAKAFNCFTIGTVGSEAKRDFALEQGCDKVIVRSDNFEEDLKNAMEGHELNIMMDSIGGKFFKIPFKALAPMGRAIVFGSARYATPSDKPKRLHLLRQYFLGSPKVDPQKLPEFNKGLFGFNLIWLYNQVDKMHEVLGKVSELNLEPPYIGHRYAFEELPDALRALQSGQTRGKVVVGC